MNIQYHLKKRTKAIWLPLVQWQHRHAPLFTCSICNYHGVFVPLDGVAGTRKYAQCPNCFALERHRIQYLVVQSILETLDSTDMRMLHFAPEPFLQPFFSSRFGQYETADLCMKNVDHKVDLQHLPFADQSYDLVFASHVLEHIVDDKKAVSEIRRILKPGGIAILPVPIVGNQTVEYSVPNSYEEDHVRAPGFDYYDRYHSYFSKIDYYSSEAFPEQFQLFIYEDRSQYPVEKFPLRQTMDGEKHIDIVPVCYV
jgi:SAM-dependent methyltransferase